MTEYHIRHNALLHINTAQCRFGGWLNELGR
jgi:hypothetical protein